MLHCLKYSPCQVCNPWYRILLWGLLCHKSNILVMCVWSYCLVLAWLCVYVCVSPPCLVTCVCVCLGLFYREHDILWVPLCTCWFFFLWRVAPVGKWGLSVAFHGILTRPREQGVRTTQDNRARGAGLEVAVWAARLCLHSRVSGK